MAQEKQHKDDAEDYLMHLGPGRVGVDLLDGIGLGKVPLKGFRCVVMMHVKRVMLEQHGLTFVGLTTGSFLADPKETGSVKGKRNDFSFRLIQMLVYRVTDLGAGMGFDFMQLGGCITVKVFQILINSVSLLHQFFFVNDGKIVGLPRKKMQDGLRTVDMQVLGVGMEDQTVLVHVSLRFFQAGYHLKRLRIRRQGQHGKPLLPCMGLRAPSPPR